MSIEENKGVVRRFITEVLGGGNIDLIDQLLAPNYANPSMGVANRTGFKAVVSGLNAAMPVRDFEIAGLSSRRRFGCISGQHELHSRQREESLCPSSHLLSSRQRADR